MRNAEPGHRRRLVPPGAMAAFVVAAAGGLIALRPGAGGPELAAPGRDPLTVAYLRAFVAGHPDDASMRLRLVREQLALGTLADAEATVAPLLADTPTPEVGRLSLEISLASWRAARAGTPERAQAEARALARVELAAGRAPTLDGITRAAVAARELGRPDLAARAQERAAVLDRERCAEWLARAAADFLAAADAGSAAASWRRAYGCTGDGPAARARALEALDAQIAADRGADALRFATGLVARFPDDREILSRAAALAFANGDAAGARRFATRLGDLGAADETVLGRLFDLDLAARDLPGALRTAQRLVRLAPADPQFRRLVARVAGWAGRPRLGLPHWMWLARRGDTAGLAQALQLAHALEDDAAVAELLTDQARRRPLTEMPLAELASALERLGLPDRAVAVLEDAARRSDSDATWEQLAAFHERRRDLPAAIAVRTELAQRRGPSLSGSVQLAKLQWAAGRSGAALAELGGWSDAADRGETEYWQLLSELAWQQESDELATRAYRTLWNGGQIEPVGAERLIILSREAGRSADAIRYGREGWVRLGEPRLLVIAMDEAASAGRWDELARLRREAVRHEPQFAGSLSYWLLCAQLDRRAGRVADAARDYRSALAVDGGSAMARSGLIWLLIDSGDRDGLSTALATWAAEAKDDPGLWRAYAGGLERLGRIREALAFYRREADADPDDAETRARYLAAVHRSMPPAAAPSPSIVTAELGVTSLGSVMMRRLGVVARTPVRQFELEGRAGLTHVSAGEQMPPLSRDAVDLLAGATVTGLGGRTEIFGGASVQRDGTVARATLAHTRELTRRAQLRLEAAVNDVAPESAILVVESVRTRAGGALALTSGRLWGRAVGEWKTWSTRSGTWLGRGGAGSFELGLHARLGDPEISLRLQGGYQRNQVATVMPGAPLLPDELAMLGVGLGAPRWTVGRLRLLLDAWLGWMAPPQRAAYRLQTGFAITPFEGAELSLAGYVANDNWILGRGEVGMTASLAYRFSHPRS